MASKKPLKKQSSYSMTLIATRPSLPCESTSKGGSSFEIPAHVFQEIENSRLVIADLTDEKQSVYCEVGYAKARGVPFFLTFHWKAADTGKGPTTAALNKVHLDLAPYRYIEYETTHELRDKLKQELDAWHDQG
jgi:hypothetical protein